MKELISIIERNIQIENWINDNKKDKNFTLSIALDLIFIYTHFCNLKLNLGMFVPAVIVNAKWEVLEEPEMFDLYVNPTHKVYEMSEKWLDKCEQYQTAKDNVLFEGFDYSHNDVITLPNKIGFIDLDDNWIIEELVELKPTLTKKGLEISGLNR